jgi:pimeloyl-ACP methyl ester carboxylesterase
VLLTLVTVAFGVFLLVGVMVATVWWRQERIAYQPPSENPAPPSAVRRVNFTASDGQPLYAYIVEPASPNGPPLGTLLAFHGNADLATWQIPWAQEAVARTGWRLILAEYRGYGGLPGVPDYAGVQRDSRAVWDYVCKHVATTPGVYAIFGHSLGSAVAVELASSLADELSTTTPAVLLLQSPFTSARDMVRVISTRPVQLLWSRITRVHYDSRMRLARLNTPVWIAHGVRDWLIPVGMGRELHRTARRPGRLLLVNDAGHNDVDERGSEAYWRWLSEALAEAAVTAHAGSMITDQSGSTRRTETSG